MPRCRSRTKRCERSPVMCREEARLLVLVRDGREVSADDLPVGILADVVLGHLKHTEVKVGDGAEGTTCDENDGLLVGIAEDTGEAVGGKGVVGRIGELRRRRGVHVGRHDEGGGGGMQGPGTRRRGPGRRGGWSLGWRLGR